MTERNRLNYLINKYLRQEIEVKELTELESLVRQSDNKQIFEEAYRQHLADTSQKLELNPIASFDRYQKRYSSKKVVMRPRWQVVTRVAAVFALLGVLTWLWVNDTSADLPDQVALAQIDMGNGHVVPIYGSSTDTIWDDQNTMVALYDDGVLTCTSQGAIQTDQHTVSVPAGQRLQVVLADASVVHLNSASALTYAPSFENLERRSVAITGEGFFDVAHDASKPFEVTARDITIQVLGTRFNVTAHADADRVITTLEEGSVKIVSNNKNAFSNDVAQYLVPGEQMVWEVADQSLSKNIVSTVEYTGWMDGYLSFNNTPFEEITRALERKYNVDIDISNDELKSTTFTAKFKDESIMDILTFFSRTGIVYEFYESDPSKIEIR